MERLRCAAHKITTFPRFLQDRVIWRELRSHVVEQPLGVITEEIAPGSEQVFAAVVDLLERLLAPNLSEED